MAKLFILASLLTTGAMVGRADVVVTLDNPLLTGAPGDTLMFTGTIQNDGLEPTFLNADSLNLAGSSFSTIDLFFANVPVSLGAGESTGDIELFDIVLSSPFLDSPGNYGGTYSLFGGVDENALDLLGAADFAVTASQVNTVPEPQSLAAAILALAILRRRARSVYAIDSQNR